MANYLVTGGAGFIGSHLCRRLVEEGHCVRVLDDFSSGRRENLAQVEDQIDLLEGDLRDQEVLERAGRDVDYILHHAAVASVQASVERPLFEQEVNAVGTLRLLEQARRARVKRVVFAASAAAYGNNPAVPQREDMLPQPGSPYGVSKVTGEYYCQVYSQVFGLETVCLRYFNIFGPRQDPSSPYSGVISIFAERLLADRAPTIFGDGEQSRDFAYVDNVVEANLLACGAGRAGGQVYNIGCGRRTTIRELVKAMNQALGTAIEPIFAPARPGEVRHSLADLSRAQQELGYRPVVHFEEGLERTVEWMRARSA